MQASRFVKVETAPGSGVFVNVEISLSPDTFFTRAASFVVNQNITTQADLTTKLAAMNQTQLNAVLREMVGALFDIRPAQK